MLMAEKLLIFHAVFLKLNHSVKIVTIHMFFNNDSWKERFYQSIVISASNGVCSEEFATDKTPYLVVLESNYNRELIGTRVVLAHSDVVILHFKVSYRNQY